ncbi:MAG: nitroreductase family protein, partial [Myxococcota bacterium]
MLPFDDAVRARRSIRAFLPEPLPDREMREMFELAGRAPSNCNTQPWRA